MRKWIEVEGTKMASFKFNGVTKLLPAGIEIEVPEEWLSVMTDAKVPYRVIR